MKIIYTTSRKPKNFSKPFFDGSVNNTGLNAPVVGIMIGNGYNGTEKMGNGIFTLDGLSVSHEVQGFDCYKNPDAVLKYAENAEKEGLKVIVVESGNESEYFSRLVKCKTTIPVLTVPNPPRNYNSNFETLVDLQRKNEDAAYETILDACRIVANSDKNLTRKLKVMQKYQASYSGVSADVDTLESYIQRDV